MENNECICEGNWRNIIKDCEHLIREIFIDENDDAFRLIGVLHGHDDYYYAMIELETGQLQLYSCVLNLHGYGFTLYEK
jgi:hypothetical protein